MKNGDEQRQKKKNKTHNYFSFSSRSRTAAARVEDAGQLARAAGATRVHDRG